jgi:site-specific DNA recombinase
MKDKSDLHKNVGIWIRVSTEEQAGGDSPKIHEARARANAMSRDWTVREVYDLSGVSGKAVMQHPECKRMMADVRRGHITGLIFSKLARLSRNLREVQDFGDFFREKDADLISLNEAIDTSTAGGRMFFNLLGVFAQWEREETSERINASFKTRAKMGMLLNKTVPYGFKVENGKVVLHPEEAPIKRLVFDLFLQVRRKYTVAQMLNDKGYLTRKGRKWEETQIKDLLTDTASLGVYYNNKVKRIGPWKTVPKPESEWGEVKCPRIVSDAIWTESNRILEEQSKRYKRPGRLPAQTFSKLVWCGCGGKMYARTDSPKYLCRQCNNKYAIVDLENIFHGKVRQYFANPTSLAKHIAAATKRLGELETGLENHRVAITKTRTEMTQVMDLYKDGKIPKNRFEEFFKPVETRLTQLEEELPKMEADVDLLKVNRLSQEDILAEAASLADRWPSLPLDDRRKVAEAICDKIVIQPEPKEKGEGRKISISYSGRPSSEGLCKNLTHL